MMREKNEPQINTDVGVSLPEGYTDNIQAFTIHLGWL
jgi:hypothetical protein